MPTDPNDVIVDHPQSHPGYVIEADGYGYVVKNKDGVVHQSERSKHTSDPLTNMQRAKVWLQDHA